MYALTLLAALLGPAQEKDKPESVADLIRRLGDDEVETRDAASKKLVARGEEAVPALADATSSSDPEVKRRAARALKLILVPSQRGKAGGMKFALVTAGDLRMGSPGGEKGRRPDEDRHDVRITRPFYLGAFEVTQKEYFALTKSNPSWFLPKAGAAKAPDEDSGLYPVENVTWFDAVHACNLLSAVDGYKAYYELANLKKEGGAIVAADVKVLGGNGYRLPTEAEWEHACRAGTEGEFHFGKVNTGKEANVKARMVAGGYGMVAGWRDVGRTAKVGSYPANSLGLHDMHGNVAEWCWDRYGRDFYAASPKADPTGPDKGPQRVLRGGSWVLPEESARSAARAAAAPSDRKYFAGFRVARSIGPPR